MLPEVTSLHNSHSLFRLPPTLDVPVTSRVRRLIDTAAMRRLGSISQLGMVSLVYPGATHSRLEHSIGVYYNAVRLLARFSEDSAFTSQVTPAQAEAFLVASLVHDIGHWPFCHPIEDMRLPELDAHEKHASTWLRSDEVASCIDQDWSCTVDDVSDLLGGKHAVSIPIDPFPEPSPFTPSLTPAPKSPGSSNCDDAAASGSHRSSDSGMRFLTSCLSGPIDVDKLDYLQRDSLHAGVPYGRNFDESRLINSMCVHPERNELAISSKGRTAAEMMVFARYVMFSEVYWHHTVRAATAMLQRGVFLLQNRMDLPASLRLTDSEWIAMFRRMAEGTVAEPLAEGLFGPRRQIYKRLVEFNVVGGGDAHRRLARRPYWWLVACAEKLAAGLAQRSGIAIHAADVLIDAPPVKLEVDINIDVIASSGEIRSLGEVSPVASALANRQFDDQVKRVRVFVREGLRSQLRETLGDDGAIREELLQAADLTEHEIS